MFQGSLGTFIWLSVVMFLVILPFQNFSSPLYKVFTKRFDSDCITFFDVFDTLLNFLLAFQILSKV